MFFDLFSFKSKKRYNFFLLYIYSSRRHEEYRRRKFNAMWNFQSTKEDNLQTIRIQMKSAFFSIDLRVRLFLRWNDEKTLWVWTWFIWTRLCSAPWRSLKQHFQWMRNYPRINYFLWSTVDILMIDWYH